jgi:glycosyltransferase involved in cell wall biosynthesis
MGHPFYRKGVDVLIKAFLKVSDKFPGMKLKIVGHCPNEQEKARYVEMAGGNARVEILNPVFYDDAVKLIQDCTFFVLPSRSEAMGRVLIEAMACGKAVIGSNVGGIPDVIKDGENGLLFNSGDVDDLAKKMDTLLSNRGLMDAMGKRGAEIVDKKFSSKRYVENFYDAVSSSG